MEIVRREKPSDAEAEFIYGQLRKFNAAHTGQLPRKDLHIFAYGPDQQVVGGLFGAVGWGWLHIDILWVDDTYRKQGLGGKLLKQAEAESLAIGVDRGYLETTDFQA